MIENGKDKLEWERKVDSKAVDEIKLVQKLYKFKYNNINPNISIGMHSTQYQIILLEILEFFCTRFTKYLTLLTVTFLGER